MKNYIILAICLGIGQLSYSQLNNSLLFNANPDSLISTKKKFGYMVDNLNYMRNTEYRSNIEQGATWAGTQLWPSAFYRYNKALSFRAGLFIQKDFGSNDFRKLIPTYTLTYSKKNIKINFGTLDGSLDHKLIEPLYATENFIDKRIENGLQVKAKFKRLTFDHWVDWEKMIYRTSTSQERFTVGFSGNIKCIDKTNFKLKIPIQVIGRHEGGEIYAQPHLPLKTQFNFAYGVHITQKMPNSFIDKIDFQGFVVFYEDLISAKADSFIDGNGQYLTLSLHHKYLGLMFNYWDAHQFISPLGEPYYLSKSREYPGDYRQYRKMFMARLLYERRIWNHASFVGRLNIIYDVSEKQMNNVAEVYFKFNIGNK